MALISFIDGCECFKKVIQRKNACYYIAYIERIVALVLIIFLLSSKYLNCWRNDILKEYPVWNETFRTFLKNYTVKCFIGWILFVVILEQLLRVGIIRIECNFKIRFMPLWNTIRDFIDLCFSSILLLFSINALIEYSHNYDIWSSEKYRYVYILGAIYMFCKFFLWIYIKNSNAWFELEREYTNYYDSNGKRIAKDDYIVYYGKRYKIYFTGGVRGINTLDKKEWRLEDLSSTSCGNNISLEDAVKDSAGNLFVEKNIWDISKE